jgi:hypothetical protein
VRPEGLGQFKKNPPHQDLNPRPSGRIKSQEDRPLRNGAERVSTSLSVSIALDRKEILLPCTTQIRSQRFLTQLNYKDTKSLPTHSIL